jgi:capsular exopolysaccharide synthesis family protein
MASDESNTSPRLPSRSSYYYGQGSFWESLQVLYSNIQLLNSDRPIKSFVVSSAVPGDGKSTVAFSLAKTAAIMGKKVLLVDCDLRKPKVHKLSQLNNLWGISSLISSDIDVEQVIQKIPGLNDLSVITAGPVPPDPARLLSSDKMSQLMDYFTENFDLVIYDTPPLSGLVDARLVAVHTDGVMLVVRIDKTDKSVAKQLVDTLKASPINLLGLVVNGDKFRGLGYNYNYRYSSYYYTKSQAVS